MSDRCVYCDREFHEQVPRTKDHVIPRSVRKGPPPEGAFKGANLVDACDRCNTYKANFMPKRLRKMAREHEEKARIYRQIADRAEQIIKERKLL